jgi:hypothetical protein
VEGKALKTHSHIGFWIIWFLVFVLASPAVIPAQKIYDRLNIEAAGINDVFGPHVGRAVLSGAATVHDYFVDCGGDAAVRQGIHSERERKQARQYFSFIGEISVDVLDGYLEGLAMQFYGVVLRAIIVGVWALLLAPFLGATLFDGICARQVKLSELGYQNPTAFSIGAHALILMLALPLMYIAVPAVIPPTFMFWWGIAAALPMGFAISHMQPVLTR